MADNIDPARRSANMRNIKSEDTKPELRVRKLVHSLGYRYRLHRKDLPGKPDLVFPSRKRVIFVHGCFWHQHNSSSCKISRKPKSNQTYWNEKLRKNMARDAENQKKLRESGWDAMIIWECETDSQPELEQKLIEFLMD